MPGLDREELVDRGLELGVRVEGCDAAVRGLHEPLIHGAEGDVHADHRHADDVAHDGLANGGWVRRPGQGARLGVVRRDDAFERVGDPELLERPRRHERGDPRVLVHGGDEHAAQVAHGGTFDVVQICEGAHGRVVQPVLGIRVEIEGVAVAADRGACELAHVEVRSGPHEVDSYSGIRIPPDGGDGISARTTPSSLSNSLRCP